VKRGAPQVNIAYKTMMWDKKSYRITAVQRFIGDRQEATAELLA
jgi:hypothetical protein